MEIDTAKLWEMCKPGIDYWLSKRKKTRPRIERGDVEGEIALRFVEKAPLIAAARNPRAYAKAVARTARTGYLRKLAQDVLFGASSLINKEGEDFTDGAIADTYGNRWNDEPLVNEWTLESGDGLPFGPPPKCPECGNIDFTLAYDKQGVPWWICGNGDRIPGHWRTGLAIANFLRRYGDVVEASRQCSSISSAYDEDEAGYAPWESLVDAKVDIDRAAKALTDEEKRLVYLRFILGRNIQEIALTMGRSLGWVSKVCDRAVRKMSNVLGSPW